MDAFRPRGGQRDGFTIDDRDEIIPRFHEYEREIEGGSYELYAEVLRRVAVRIAKDIGWPLEPSRAGFLPDSVQRWPAVQGDQPATEAVRREVPDRPDLEHRRQAAGPHAPAHPARFDLVVTAQQVRSYKPDPAHFTECARRIGTKKGWVHIAAEILPRRRAVPEGEDPGHLGQPHKEKLEPGQKKPTVEVKSLLEAAKLLGAA